MRLRWWLLFCSSATALFLCWQFGLLDALHRADQTYLGFGCIGIYFGASLYLGLTRYPNLRALDYTAELLYALGFLGTLIGMILMFSSGGAGLLNIADVAAVQKSIMQMLAGIATALTTTLVGMVTHYLLRLQLLNNESA